MHRGEMTLISSLIKIHIQYLRGWQKNRAFSQHVTVVPEVQTEGATTGCNTV